MDLLFTLLILVPAVVVVIVYPRAMKQLREGGDQEWRERWRELDPARRKRILATMRRGEALPPEDAELGSRAVRQLEFASSAMRPVELAMLPLLLLLIAWGLVEGDVLLVVIPAAGLAFSLPLRVTQGVRRRKMRRSLEASGALPPGSTGA
jgi:hypothetical protein